MYHWINKHLKLGLPEPIIEEDFKPLSVEEASVWNAEHPRPSGGPEHERALLHWMTADAEQQIQAFIPRDLKTIIGGAWQAIIGRGLPAAGSVVFEPSAAEKRHERYAETVGLIRNAAEKEELPAVLLTPKYWNNRVAVWIDGEGKAGLYTSAGLKPAVEKLLEGGMAVLGVDLLYQGEFLADGKPLKKTRRVSTPPDSATPLASPTATICRCLLSACTTCSPRSLPRPQCGTRRLALGGWKSGKSFWSGWTGAGPGLRRPQRSRRSPSAPRRSTRPAFVSPRCASIDDPDFMPGGAKYLDVPGLLALCSPLRLWVAGERDNPPPLVKSVYETLGKSQRLTISEARAEDRPLEAATWILRAAEKGD